MLRKVPNTHEILFLVIELTKFGRFKLWYRPCMAHQSSLDFSIVLVQKNDKL